MIVESQDVINRGRANPRRRERRRLPAELLALIAEVFEAAERISSPASRGRVSGKPQVVVLPRHSDGDVADALSVVQPLAHDLDLLRRRLALRVDEREVEGGGEESAVTGRGR